MNTLLVLQNRAVKAAQEERWEDAQALNQEILDQDPNNISALNRLGFSFLQSADMDRAQATYERVLELDKANPVAKKYLEAIAEKKPVKLPKALRHSEFIDEPGKTRSVHLVKLAEQDVLEELSIGSECSFKNSKGRLSVLCDGEYIGSLPDDLASRLRPLVEAGTEYSAKVQSLKNGAVIIFMRELKRGAGVEHIASFPAESLNLLAIDHSELARDEEDPVYVAETENDEGGQAMDNIDLDDALDSDTQYPEFTDDDEE